MLDITENDLGYIFYKRFYKYKIGYRFVFIVSVVK